MTPDDKNADREVEAPSLAGYLRKTVKIAALAKAWNKDGLSITVEDLASAQAVAAEDPRTLLRVVEIIRAARRAPPAIRSAVGELGAFIVRSAAPQLSNWRDDDGAGPSDDLERLARWAKGPLAGKDKAAKLRAEAVLCVALAMLGDHPRLDPLRAVAAMGEAFGVAPPDNDTDQRPARRVSALLAKNKPRQIATLARISVLQDALLARATLEADRQRLRCRKLDGDVAAARGEVAELRVSQASLQAEIARLERENTDLAGKLESAQRIGAHMLDDLKSRYRRVFRAELSPVAADAKAALEIAPPRPDFAIDYLATVISTINKELTWLDEPSE